MGTQATHVDKLRRVWPHYVSAWREHCNLELEGLEIWVHEAGWTPFTALVNFLLTGRGGILSNSKGEVLDRYLARAVNGALATELSPGLTTGERRRAVEALRWCKSAREAIDHVGARLLEGVDPGAIPLPSASVDLVHSGGALEHYTVDQLSAFLAQCRRILRPGGVASHVLDHRDHLHHADGAWPFLGHLALPGPLYRAAFGHPLSFHNRLSPSRVSQCFEAAGFQRVAVRRMILPEGRYIEPGQQIPAHARSGLPRWLLAPEFSQISDDDLRTAAAHYLYRNPD
jgi:SAM-dependent methyltransferase